MSIELRGKPIAITGASSGIGAATALACARAGMPVALGARRLYRLNELAAQINAAGGKAWAFEVDVADAAASQSFIERAVTEFGSLYAVFANAGYGDEATMHQMPDEAVRRMFDVNVYGSLNVIRPAVTHMLAHGVPPRRGHVLWCSSCLALFAGPYGGCYAATKAAQHQMSRAMRSELAGDGIAVSSVHPIGTETEFSKALLERAGRTERARTTPSLLMQPASRVADGVVACLRRPRAEVWPGVRARTVKLLMAAGAVYPPLGDVVRRRLIRKKL